MRIAYNVVALLLFAARRVWHNLPLMAGTAIGLIASVALVGSIPLYADGVNTRLLTRSLAQQEKAVARPPYAFMFSYIGGWFGSVDWPAYQNADRFLASESPAVLGLPLDMTVRYVRTDSLRLFPSVQAQYEDEHELLDRVAVGFVSNLQDHIRILEGSYPRPQSATDNGPLDVIVSEQKAAEMGIQVGEEFIVIGENGPQGVDMSQIPVRIVGVWRERDAADSFWFYHPGALDNHFLVPEESFANRVVPLGKKPVYQAQWYLIFDGRGVHTEDVPSLLWRVNQATMLADKALPHTSLDISPLAALGGYVNATHLLTILMFVFAIPIIGLVLYFVSLTTNLVVQRQRNEIAVLRSRGMSVLQVVAVYLLEGAILGSVAVVLGPLLGKAIAQAMGAARSFLEFSTASPLLIRVSPQSLRLGVVAVAVALAGSTLPALGAARHTIVTYKQDVARSLQKPWWQTLYLDVLLLAVSLYGYFMLRQRGTISLLGGAVTAAEGDPFANPLLFLVPTLFVFALAMMFIRLFPLLSEMMARLAAVVPAPAPLLALRQLARSSGYYTGPLLLIVLTMGLSCFTASMARTLDAALNDQSYYSVGADLRLSEQGEIIDAGLTSSSSFSGESGTQASGYWSFLPVSEHLKVKEVQAAARWATFAATVNLGRSQAQGKIVGIDRLDYLRTAYFRRDFAPSSLGALINNLAQYEDAVLAPASFLGTFALAVGDSFTLRVYQNMQSVDVPMTVAGVVDLFPGTYPDEGPVFVANLDYLFDQLGGEYPYDVLLRVAPGSNTKQLVSELGDVGLRIRSVTDSRQLIEDERQRPERQGILGLLSVGALTASFLTVLGLLFYSFVSFRRRFVEIGVLRAIGLSSRQLVVALGLEQLALIVTGVLAGTACGVLASDLFIPFLQVRGGAHAQIPPYVVQIAWGDIFKVHAIFAVMLLATVAVLVWLLNRMRIADAVKLGEIV